MKIILEHFVKPCLVLKIIVFLFFCLHFTDGQSQNNWHEKRFYASRGGSDVICGPIYTVKKRNELGWWLETWKNCRKRVWHQEFYSGFINYWGPKGWYREWKKGNFWYFNWYDYPVRIS